MIFNNITEEEAEMLDVKRIREDFDNVKKAVESRKQGDFGIDNVLVYDKKRRELLAEVEQMKNKQSVSSKQIPKMKKEGQDTTELMAEMKALPNVYLKRSRFSMQRLAKLRQSFVRRCSIFPTLLTKMCRREKMILQM